MKNIFDIDKLIEKLQQTEEGKKLLRDVLLESNNPAMKRVTDVVHSIVCSKTHIEGDKNYCGYLDDESQTDPWILVSHIEWKERTVSLGRLCGIESIEEMEQLLVPITKTIQSIGSDHGPRAVSLLNCLMTMINPDESADTMQLMSWSSEPK